MQVDKTVTIKEMIEAGKNAEMSYYNSSYIEKIGNIEYSVHNIIHDYMDEIEPYLQTVTLSESEYRKYKYRPRLLAYDLYGSTDLYFLIMIFNNLCDIKEFDMRKVKLLSRTNLSIINKIFITEKEYINKSKYILNTSPTIKQTSNIKNESNKTVIYIFPFNHMEYQTEGPPTEEQINKHINDCFAEKNKVYFDQFEYIDFDRSYLNNDYQDFLICAVPLELTEYRILRYGRELDKEQAAICAAPINGEYIMFRIFPCSFMPE